MKKGLIFCISLLVFIFLMPVRAFATDLNGENWMSALPDDRYLYEFNIPGSHDAATATAWHDPIKYAGINVEPVLVSFAVAQDKTIAELLNSGVRALDLRLTNWVDGTEEADGTLILAHGDENEAFCFRSTDSDGFLTLVDVLDTVVNFLENNPTETVILKVKEEYDDGKHKEVWSSIKSTIEEYEFPERLYIEDRWPTLGEVRGKAVISTDNKGSLGMDVIEFSTGDEQATTDCSRTDTIDPVHLFYENHWDVKVDDKEDYVNQYLNSINETLGREGEKHFDTAGMLYSSSNVITTDVATIIWDIYWFITIGYVPDDWQWPRYIANTVNPALHDSVTSMPDRKYFGIVLSDFSEEVLDVIWKSNYPGNDWDYYKKYLIRYFDEDFSLLHFDLVVKGDSTTAYEETGWHNWEDLDDQQTLYPPGYEFTPNRDMRLGYVANYIQFRNEQTGSVTDWPEDIAYYPNHSDTVVLPDNVPKLSGRVFIEWRDDNGVAFQPGQRIHTAGLDEYFTLHAHWETAEDRWYVVYNANGGSGAPSPTSGIEFMDIELSRDVPEAGGRRFKGWAENPCSAEPDYQPGQTIHWEYVQKRVLVIYALWELDPAEEPVTVSFDANGVEGADMPDNISLPSGNRAKLERGIAPLGGQYVFLGWSKNPDAYEPEYHAGEIYYFTDNTELYAIWKRLDFMMLMFRNPIPGEASGVPDPVSIVPSESRNVHIPSRIPEMDGRIFTGWNTLPHGDGTGYAPGSDITLSKRITVLYAQWEMAGDSWYVIYNANGGTQAPDPQIVNKGEDAVLTRSLPENGRLRFRGWARGADASEPEYQPQDTLPYEEGRTYVVLYANWELSPGPRPEPGHESDDDDSKEPVKAAAVNPDALIAYFLVNGVRLESATFAKQSQGPLGMAAFNIGRPAGWKQAFTFNMMVNGKADHTAKNGYLVLVIPSEYQKAGRSYAIMGLDKSGKAHIFNDFDTIPSTVTARVDLDGYAFGLIYKD